MTTYELPEARRTDFVRSADGTRINVEEYGPQGAPTVVLIHGWTCRTLFWAPLIHELGGEFRVVVYDQRGHGRSETPGSGGYGTEALADDLTAVLDAFLGDDEPATAPRSRPAPPPSCWPAPAAGGSSRKRPSCRRE
jgi:pimeloyl-ACP methyl ester carboxylesterase